MDNFLKNCFFPACEWNQQIVMRMTSGVSWKIELNRMWSTFTCINVMIQWFKLATAIAIAIAIDSHDERSQDLSWHDWRQPSKPRSKCWVLLWLTINLNDRTTMPEGQKIQWCSHRRLNSMNDLWALWLWSYRSFSIFIIFLYLHCLKRGNI